MGGVTVGSGGARGEVRARGGKSRRGTVVCRGIAVERRRGGGGGGGI